MKKGKGKWNKSNLALILSILLTVLLFFGCLFSVMGVGRVEPPRTEREETEVLQAETLSGGRSGSAEDDEAEAEEVSEDAEASQEEEAEEVEEAEEDQPETEEITSDDVEASDGEDNTEDGGNAGGDGDKKSDTSSGDAGSQDDKKGNTDGGNAGGNDGKEDVDEPSIITDLDQYTAKPLTPADLNQNTLSFTAKAVGGKNLSLEVRYRHAEDKGNGSRLYVSGKDAYETPLKFGQNIITLILRQDGKQLKSLVYNIEYRQTADADNPSTGDYPPEIRMISPEEEKWPFATSNRNFTFKLAVKDTQTQKYLTAKNISVTVTNPYGEALPVTVHGESYEMWLERPNVGDVNVYTIKVTAWDEDGCSASYKAYTLTYNAVDSGNVIGKATVVLDATTVGMGILDIFTGVEIKQDESIAQVICELLPENGYEVDYGGSIQKGFYIRGLKSGAINTGTVPSRLWEMVQRDGIGLMDKGSTNWLEQHDYTQGSGWMYSINGTVYEDKGMSERYLQDGDTLYLRYTLAYGKDIGGYGTTGGSYGKFSSYCYRYVDGNEVFLGHGTMTEVQRVEPTTESAGYLIRECERCGEKEREEIPPLAPTSTPEPTASPIPTENPTPEPTEAPTPEPTEVPTPEPTVVPEPTETPVPTPVPEAATAENVLQRMILFQNPERYWKQFLFMNFKEKIQYPWVRE